MSCLFCKFSNAVVRDNHDDLHCICTCRESENFLKPIEIAFDTCDCSEMESDEE